MLFCDETIASFINQNFEPVWQSVRPVPIVSIDFGNGQVLTRTLHGNIATYVCNSQGVVLDILPGIYDRGAYLAQLDQLLLVSKYVHSDSNQSEALREYHRKQGEALLHLKSPYQLAFSDSRKVGVQGSLKIVLSAPGSAANKKVNKSGTRAAADLGPQDEWSLLVKDTMVNESVRRLAIHQRLSVSSALQPSDVTRWLYKNVLHADLDDPYLGLGSTLFPSYPFKEDFPLVN